MTDEERKAYNKAYREKMRANPERWEQERDRVNNWYRRLDPEIKKRKLELIKQRRKEKKNGKVL